MADHILRHSYRESFQKVRSFQRHSVDIHYDFFLKWLSTTWMDRMYTEKMRI